MSALPGDKVKGMSALPGEGDMGGQPMSALPGDEDKGSLPVPAAIGGS